MAAASYTEDLTDITTAETVTDVAALGGGAAGLAADPDFAIQDTNSVTKLVNGARKGMVYDTTTAIALGANDHVYTWIYCTTPGLLATRAVGGLCITIGDTVSARNEFHVVGAAEYQGGWLCVPVKYVTTANGAHPYRTLIGVPAGNPQHFGVIGDIGAVMDVNLSYDVIRYGTGAFLTAGELISAGDASDIPCTFAGFATQNDAILNRWGILTAVDSGFALQGKFVIGQTNAGVATLARFKDSNTLVLFNDTFHAAADFTQVVIDHASTRVEWTNVSFLALGTVNKGRFIMNDAGSTLIDTGGTFTDMGISTLQAGYAGDGRTWRGCGQVTANSATLLNCVFEGYEGTVDTSYLVWDTAVDTNGELDGSSFTKGTAATHAIEFGTTSPLAMTLTNIDFSGYNAANAATDSTLHIKRTTGTVDITISGGSGTVSYKTDGADVNIIAGAVTVQVTATEKDGTPVETARVFLRASDGTGPFPFEDAITSITRSAAEATVTTTAAHGLDTNDKIYIEGITDKIEDNYTVLSVTVLTTTTFTFVTTNAGSTAYTGTMTCTFVALSGVTNASGIATTSRVYSTNQPVTGWSRKSTSAPYLQEGVVVGVVDSASGIAGTAVMLTDQ